MSIDELVNEARTLSIAERMRLVEDIWDTIVEEPGSVPLSDEQRREIRRRLKDYYEDPSAGSPWEDVRARVFRSS